MILAPTELALPPHPQLISAAVVTLYKIMSKKKKLSDVSPYNSIRGLGLDLQNIFKVKVVVQKVF